MLNRKVFYEKAKIPVFGGRLTQQNVDGVEPLLDVWEARYADQPLEYLAYIIAGVFRETGGRMVPCREGFCNTDAAARKLLHKHAYAVGGWYGRGRIQNTWEKNYEKLAKHFNRPDILTNPDILITDDKLDAEVTVVGHMEGIWTGKKLSDFWHTDEATGLKVFDAKNARRIVNGLDHANEIAANYKLILQAIKAAAVTPVVVDTKGKSPAEIESDAIEATKPPVGDGKSVAGSKINWSAIGVWLSANLAALLSFFQSVDWKVIAILMGVSFIGVVMIVVFRRRIAYEFGA